jgi:hypothetical protein
MLLKNMSYQNLLKTMNPFQEQTRPEPESSE